VVKLGVVVILTFAVAWYPWATDSPQAVAQVGLVGDLGAKMVGTRNA